MPTVNLGDLPHCWSNEGEKFISVSHLNDIDCFGDTNYHDPECKQCRQCTDLGACANIIGKKGKKMAKKSKKQKKQKKQKRKKEQEKVVVEQTDKVEQKAVKKKSKKQKKQKRKKEPEKITAKTTEKKKKPTARFRDISLRPNYAHAKDAHKLPKTGVADEFQNFAVAIASMHPELIIKKGKNGFSIHHPTHAKMVLGVGGSAGTLRLTSQFFVPEEDPGCEADSKGYPTIVLENSGEEEIQKVAEIALARAKIL